MMKSRTHKVAFAAASAVSVFYVIFATLMYFIPEKLVTFVMRAHFMNPTILPMQFQLTWANAFWGLLFHFVFVYVFVWLAAEIYNWCGCE